MLPAASGLGQLLRSCARQGASASPQKADGPPARSIVISVPRADVDGCPCYHVRRQTVEGLPVNKLASNAVHKGEPSASEPEGAGKDGSPHMDVEAKPA